MSDTAPETTAAEVAEELAPTGREIVVPEPSLVVLVGQSAAGKSSFAAKNFQVTEVVASDFCRGAVCDDRHDMTANRETFEVLRAIVRARLTLAKLTVVDATNLRKTERAGLVQLAREHHVPAVAVVLLTPVGTCIERDADRARPLGRSRVLQQGRTLRQDLRGIRREGFRSTWVLDSVEAAATATVKREPLAENRCRKMAGPFDVIGDVHGCADELEELIALLGYERLTIDDNATYRHPGGRTLVFAGDICDRGPRNLDALRIALGCAIFGHIWVMGNHDRKLFRHLQGHEVKVAHGLELTLAELAPHVADVELETIGGKQRRERAPLVKKLLDLYETMTPHVTLAGGELVVAHAGIREGMIGRSSREATDFALFGDVDGSEDEDGRPIRLDWAASYRGEAWVAYGHTPTASPTWRNRTVNLDQGCVFGGRLTALRWPERTFISVPARRAYAVLANGGFLAAAPEEDGSQARPDEVLDVSDVLDPRGLRVTCPAGNVHVAPERVAAAFEVLTRHGVDPRHLIYLPPTMAPADSAPAGCQVLERPEEALEYYRQRGQHEVICEEKHMGSRMIMLTCRDERAGERAFGIPGLGRCYTRTGRPFFEPADEQEVLRRASSAVADAGLFDRFGPWIALDCEVMPWNLKARGLLENQYEPAAAFALESLSASLRALTMAGGRGVAVCDIAERTTARLMAAHAYETAFKSYCWPHEGLKGVKIAPFHLLAAEGRTFFDWANSRHVAELTSLVAQDPLFCSTEFIVVDLDRPISCSEAVRWWTEITGGGAEGMVVKPRYFFTVNPQTKRFVQPGIKVRGPEYLRIIYGPDYLEPKNLERLRDRGTKRKGALAAKEFALGCEALTRFVRHEPLRAVHECVMAVAALESEPIDPRL